RNHLVVEVEGDEGGGLWGEVALEIRRPAFLRDVQVRARGPGGAIRLHVTGEVAGTAARPLDLYVLLDGATVAYAVVEAAQFFEVVSEALPAQRCQPRGNRTGSGHTVRVELVDGGVVWYTVEQTLELA